MTVVTVLSSFFFYAVNIIVTLRDAVEAYGERDGFCIGLVGRKKLKILIYRSRNLMRAISIRMITMFISLLFIKIKVYCILLCKIYDDGCKIQDFHLTLFKILVD